MGLGIAIAGYYIGDGLDSIGRFIGDALKKRKAGDP